ncbi:MAG: T9SS type A sorting domain-containing protein [Candidatus Delongbacteria bacterium]|nr:T9SS type A sorting domain-containing protein [Candidatus Delongbacteria bacterium]
MKNKLALIFFLVLLNSLFAFSLDSSLGSGVIGSVSNENIELSSGIIYLQAKGEETGIEDNMPLKFELSHNYPNPFNPVTTIQYTIPNDQFVKLNVYNIKGEMVSELVKGDVKAGIHKVNFDGNQFTSGQYFYRIETNGFTKIQKMVLIK